MANAESPEQTGTETPGETPTKPEGDLLECAVLDDPPAAPKVPDPRKCEPRCTCPATPGSEPNCFEELIGKQGELVSKAEAARSAKAALEELLASAKTAMQGYTREKYDDFVKRWTKQDEEIVGAIKTVVCNVKCWWCVIECEICPLLYQIREIETKLDGAPDSQPSAAASLRDLEYWHQRNVHWRRVVSERIKAVLDAWKDPAKSIEEALLANETSLATIRGLEPRKQILEVFLRLVPLHLAIAPRPLETAIDAKYIDLCLDCDEGETDDCCGPDVGIRSARNRLTPLQAYIVDPDDYFRIICCLARSRYLPAQSQLSKAEFDLATTRDEIARLTADLAARTADNALSETYLAKVANPIECDNYKKKNGDGDCGCDTDDDDESTTQTTTS